MEEFGYRNLIVWQKATEDKGGRTEDKRQRTKEAGFPHRPLSVVLCRLSFVLNPFSVVLCLISFIFMKFAGCGQRAGMLE